MGYKPKDDNGFYNGNPLVKAAGAKHEFTLGEINELKKCISDPVISLTILSKLLVLIRGLCCLSCTPIRSESLTQSTRIDSRSVNCFVKPVNL